MIRVNGFYLYSTGYSIHPLAELRQDAAFQDWLLRLFIAHGFLETLLSRSIFQLETSQAAGMALSQALQGLTANPDRTEPITFMEAYTVTSALTAFEHVLTAELGQLNIFLAERQRGLHTGDMISNGAVLFPSELPRRVPEAVADLNAATRCIAFELPTAAGFHLHRANESVLHRYYDAVTNGDRRPTGRNIGDYLKALRDRKYKKTVARVVLSALRDLNDLHRNPLIHPRQSLESVDEAIGLMGSVQAVMVHMLKAIPDPAPHESTPEFPASLGAGEGP